MVKIKFPKEWVEKRDERTRALLAKFRGDKREWDLLSGILLAPHVLEASESLAYGQFFNLSLIAQRMDEMHKALVDSILAKSAPMTAPPEGREQGGGDAA